MTSTPAPDYSDYYNPDTDVDRWYTIATAERIVETLVENQKVLELGCATGLMSSFLAKANVELTCMERSPSYVKVAKSRDIERANFVTGDVETLDLVGNFDHVVATNLLHELSDPSAFLVRCLALLAPGGHIHLTLQNPLSLHRLIAFDMGLLSDLGELSERGKRYGSTGLFSRDDLANFATEAGYMIARELPIMLKPFSNAQLAGFDDSVMRGLIRCADRFPDNGAMNYLQATKPV